MKRIKKMKRVLLGTVLAALVFSSVGCIYRDREHYYHHDDYYHYYRR